MHDVDDERPTLQSAEVRLDSTVHMSGNVTIHQYGSVTNVDPLTWPSGELIKEMLEKEDVDLSKTQKDPMYWCQCARWALLKKYGLLNNEDCNPSKENRGSGKQDLIFTKEQMDTIQGLWKKAVSCSEKGDDGVIKDDGNSSSQAKDLLELFSTGKSNQRQLKWSTMVCKAGCQFKLHAHPNLELVYCAKGNLHEVRMKGEPMAREYEKIPDSDGKVKGPNLTSLRRPWYFATLLQGEWLVNEVGSVHKSFTASQGDGCVLVVLWGGSHADIAPGEEPSAPNVHETVNKMDDKLGECDCTKWETMEETFLPESERSSSNPKRKLEDATEEKERESEHGDQTKKVVK